MLRKVASRVAWVGRTASMVFGLALVLGLIFGVATMALGANGKPFILGQKNVATVVSTLVKKGAGPALSLKVGSGAPLAVNSSQKVTNLNADTLDGQDFGAFGAKVVMDQPGPLPLEKTYTSKGGTLIIDASGSGFRQSLTFGRIGMFVEVDGVIKGAAAVYTNERNSHKAFVDEPLVLEGLPAGVHTIRLEPMFNSNACGISMSAEQEDFCTTTDDKDQFNVLVTEIPN